MSLVSTKLRESANGQPCTFRIPGVCNGDSDTTVFCHIRDEAKGLGNKANDFSGAYGCAACHHAIDNHRLPKVDELWFSLRALQRTHAIMVERGLIVVPETISRPKPASKVFPHKHNPFTGKLWSPGHSDGSGT
jgi:hypothetical protein